MLLLERQTGPVMQQICERAGVRGEGVGGDTSVSLLFAAMQSAFKVILVWPHQEAAVKRPRRLFRADRNSAAARFPSDASVVFPLDIVSILCFRVLQPSSGFPLFIPPEAQAHVLLSAGSKLPLPAVIEGRSGSLHAGWRARVPTLRFPRGSRLHAGHSEARP